NLAVLYHAGKGVRRDMAEAVHWYREAAERDHAAAQTKLATIYLAGEGVRPDPGEALPWMILSGRAVRGAGVSRHRARRDAMAATTRPEQAAAAERRDGAWRRRAAPAPGRADALAGVR